MSFNDLSPKDKQFVLACASNKTKTNDDLGKEFDVHRDTIAKWKKDFAIEIDELATTLLKDAIAEIKQQLVKLGIPAVLKYGELLNAKEYVAIKDVDGNETLTGEKPNLQVQLGSAKAIVEGILPKESKTDITSGGEPIAVNFGNVEAKVEEVAQTGNG